MILIINGPCGVGKTSISKELSNRLYSCININVDSIHNFIVNSDIIPEHIEVTDQNVTDLVKNYKNAQFENIIIDNVYETPEHLNRIIDSMKKYDNKIIPIRLLCSLDENIKRDASRRNEDVCGKERVCYLYSQLNRYDTQLGCVFDITQKSINVIVNDILIYLKNGATYNGT